MQEIKKLLQDEGEYGQSYGVLNDKGSSDHNQQKFLCLLYGLNGEGYFRPDLLALYSSSLCLVLMGKGLDYFGGTCGASTLIVGLSAYLVSIMPNLTPNFVAK